MKIKSNLRSLLLLLVFTGCTPRLIERLPPEPVIPTLTQIGGYSPPAVTSHPTSAMDNEKNTPENLIITPEPAVILDHMDDLGLRKAVQYSRQDLARRLNLPFEEIQFVQAEKITWRDASLGCPKPGVFYIQVLSPGYKILLSADGQLYSYHTDQGETLILCEMDTGVQLPELIAPDETKIGTPWNSRD